MEGALGLGRADRSVGLPPLLGTPLPLADCLTDTVGGEDQLEESFGSRGSVLQSRDDC